MTSSAADVLFQPFDLKGVKLPNRIVMAPMTRAMAPEGVPGAANAAYYRRRAEGGVGLILTEGTVVDRPASRNEPGIPFIHGDDAMAGWRGVVEAVHGAGGKIGPQIWHTGATSGNSGWEPEAEVESPSGLLAPGTPRGKAMTDADIADTIAAFAKSAAQSKAAGFDVVELHGAHGYLIDEFFWPGTNQRTDAWGGATIAERSRFAVETIKAVRAAIGPDLPLIIRLSQWKQQDYAARLATTPDEMAAWLTPLVDAGADVLHASQRRYWESEFPEIDGPEGLNFAGWAKKLTGATTISVGSVGLEDDFFGAFTGNGSANVGVERLVTRMEKGEFDLVAVGRVLLSDPNWAAKVRDGRASELKGFVPESLAELV